MRLNAQILGVDAARREMQRIGALPRMALARTAEQVETFVEDAAGRHSKTGNLVASIGLRRDGEAYEVGHDLQRARHALFVHWGARPHVIKPKAKGALRWAGGGAFHFAKVVHHPGYRGDPWMTRAAAFAPREFDRQLQLALAQTGA